MSVKAAAVSSPLAMKKRRIVLLALLAFCAANGNGFAAEGPCLALKGRLVKVSTYGPPGYGETPEKDDPITLAILMLAQPRDLIFSVVDDTLAVENAVGAVGLKYVDPAWTDGLFDREVQAVGCLEQPVRGYEKTPVVMWLQMPPRLMPSR